LQAQNVKEKADDKQKVKQMGTTNQTGVLAGLKGRETALT